jgi:hypothetical protein
LQVDLGKLHLFLKKKDKYYLTKKFMKLRARPVALNSFVWGPKMWDMLHTASFSGHADARQLSAVLDSFRTVCPCQTCKASFGQLLKHRELDLARLEDKDLSVYTWKLHNAVNVKLGKPAVPYYQVKLRYDSASRAQDAISFWDLVHPVAENSFQTYPRETVQFVHSAMDLAKSYSEKPETLLELTASVGLDDCHDPADLMHRMRRVRGQLMKGRRRHSWKKSIIYSNPDQKKL